MRLVTLVLAATTAVAPWTASIAQVPMYSLSSKAHGAPFDLVVTEIKREETNSQLSVSGFHNRTAPGARWLMCVYAELVIMRGFKYWSVMYPDEGSETLIVGFSNSATTSPKEVIGPQFAKERVVGDQMMPVEKFVTFCGMRR